MHLGDNDRSGRFGGSMVKLLMVGLLKMGGDGISQKGNMVGNFDDTLAAMKNKIIGKEEAVRLAHSHDDALVSWCLYKADALGE